MKVGDRFRINSVKNFTYRVVKIYYQDERKIMIDMAIETAAVFASDFVGHVYRQTQWDLTEIVLLNQPKRHRLTKIFT